MRPTVARPARLLALALLTSLAACADTPLQPGSVDLQKARPATDALPVMESGPLFDVVYLPLICRELPWRSITVWRCGTASAALAINDSGTVVGVAEVPFIDNDFPPPFPNPYYRQLGAIWRMDGRAEFLDWSQLYQMAFTSVDNRGNLVAEAYPTEHGGWSFLNGHEIGFLPDRRDNHVQAMNNRLELVGYGYAWGDDRSAEGDRAFYWHPDPWFRELEWRMDPSWTDGVSSYAYDLNDSGFAVGVAGDRGVLWNARQGGVTDLAALLRVSSVRPRGINNKGEIVGTVSGVVGSSLPAGGFIWSVAGGLRVIDSRDALDINDSSVVLGAGYVWTAKHGTLEISLPGNVGKINNRNQVPGTVGSRAVRYDVHLPPTNQSPIAIAGGPYAGQEGTAVTLSGIQSSDPDRDALTYSWSFGDGTGTAGPTRSHIYLDNGIYTVTLTVTDPSGASSTASTTAVIANVAPSVQMDALSDISSGQSAHLHGSFTDPGLQDMPWQYSIHWGAGDPSTGTISSQPSSIWRTSPRYCAAGSYVVRLSVTDKDGGTGTATSPVTVSRIEVPLDVLTGTVNPRAHGELPVAVLGTNNLDVRQLDLSTVTLGDGMTGLVSVAVHPNGRYFASVEDVNGDGQPDLILHFDRERLQAAGVLTAPNASLVLLGRLSDHCREVRGTQTVRVIAR